MKHLFSPFYALLILALSFSSCAKKTTPEEQARIDKEIIVKYIADKGLNAIEAASGLFYVVENPGIGIGCTSTSTVKVAYKGYTTDGEVFDESASGVVFRLDQVIRGWTEGITYFKEGGNGILLVPSAMAYGPKGNSSIAGNTVLIFDIELLDVQ